HPATEVEWAKNRRLTPEAYRGGLDGHEPPIPPDLMARVFREYELRKASSGLVDFEDLLEQTVRMYEEDEWALAALRERFRAFTVDEYQDVNLLQQTLLELWLGDGGELCAVGDDYQSIYGFTGASPEWLLGLASRYPQATVVRLEDNYRSTPEVLSLPNRLVPRLGGAEEALRARRPSGGGSRRSWASSSRFRTASASASSCGRRTSRGCASWRRSSTTARRRSSSGSSGFGPGSTTAPRVASTC